MNGEINEDLVGNDDTILPGPELGGIGFKLALEAKDELNESGKVFEIEYQENVTIIHTL